MFRWILSNDKKYLFAKHNSSIRADLSGNIYGGGMETVAAIAAIASAGTGMYSAYQASKAAKSQQSAWESMAEPQKEYMRQMYPMQLEMMQEYLPYYKDVLGAQKELLPYSQKALMEQYYPMYGKTYEDVLAYGAEGVQPWEKQAISVPFAETRTRLGERAAGAGTLRAGPTQKLATLYDIAEAEALTRLPYERKQQALEQQFKFLGYTPTTPSVSAPGEIGVSIPAQPAPYQAEPIDWGSIGDMIGYGGGGTTPSIPTGATSYGGGSWGMSTPYAIEPGMTGWGM